MDRCQRRNADKEGVASVATQSAFSPTLLTVTARSGKGLQPSTSPQIYCTERAYLLTFAHGIRHARSSVLSRLCNSPERVKCSIADLRVRCAIRRDASCQPHEARRVDYSRCASENSAAW
jgi:hypothetical protein